MKKSLLLLVFSLFISVFITNQELKSEISIKRGIPIETDGVMSNNEWDDADTCSIYVGPGWEVKIYYKHDGEHLLMAFHGVQNSSSLFVFPEILIDTNNNKANEWNEHHLWLHASATDCEAWGDWLDYSNCHKIQTDWWANNAPLSTANVIEMKVTLAKFGVSEQGRKTVGMSFDVTNTQSYWLMYPDGAEVSNPSTWETAVFDFSDPSAVRMTDQATTVKVYPNPLTDRFTIEFPNLLLGGTELKIYDLYGKLVDKAFYKEDTFGIVYINEKLVSGRYFVKVINQGNVYYDRVIVR